MPPKWRAAIFVNGCYWHVHNYCHLYRSPKTLTEFLTTKIEGNQVWDQRNHAALKDAGWKVLIIWKYSVSKKLSLSDEQLEIAIAAALVSSATLIEIRG